MCKCDELPGTTPGVWQTSQAQDQWTQEVGPEPTWPFVGAGLEPGYSGPWGCTRGPCQSAGQPAVSRPALHRILTCKVVGIPTRGFFREQNKSIFMSSIFIGLFKLLCFNNVDSFPNQPLFIQQIFAEG